MPSSSFRTNDTPATPTITTVAPGTKVRVNVAGAERFGEVSQDNGDGTVNVNVFNNAPGPSNESLLEFGVSNVHQAQSLADHATPGMWWL